MGRVSRARRIALAAAYGGGGMGVSVALLTGVLVGQALLARRTIPLAESPPPRCDGRYGTGHDAPPIILTVLGDSSAAGYGVDSARLTPGALLAAGLAEQLHRPVELHCHAVVGAESVGLAAQVDAALEHPNDLALILIGGNDITRRVPIPEAVAHLLRAVRRLHAAGVRVVVGTCPDLGAVTPIQPPLRWLVGTWCRQMAAAQTIAVVEAGGRTVSLGDLLGPAFAAEPTRMFAQDRFHPSADGYAAAAAAILPTLVAALSDRDETGGSARHGEGVRTLPQAAVEAVGRPGTEVSAARTGDAERGPAARLAQLRHRVWRRTETPTEPRVNRQHLPSERQANQQYLPGERQDDGSMVE